MKKLSPFGLLLLASFFGPFRPAFAGPYAGSLKDHGHTGPGDGGLLTNAKVSGTVSSSFTVAGTTYPVNTGSPLTVKANSYNAVGYIGRDDNNEIEFTMYKNDRTTRMYTEDYSVSNSSGYVHQSISRNPTFILVDTSSKAVAFPAFPGVPITVGGATTFQIVQATASNVAGTCTSSANSFVSCGSSGNGWQVSITPRFTTSRIRWSFTCTFRAGASASSGQYTIERDSTNLANTNGFYNTATHTSTPVSAFGWDSPGDTSAHVYAPFIKSGDGVNSVDMNTGGGFCTIEAVEYGQ